MPERPRHVIKYEGRKYAMDYVFKAEIAALRAHKTGQFQEIVILEWIRKFQLKGTYVDAGAHIGNHTLYFLNHCPSKRVISIEAHPIIHKLMVGNIERNGEVVGKAWTAYQRAAWNRSGDRVQMAPIPRNNAGHCHIVRKGERGEVDVITVCIDDVVPQGDVSVLKIDVEDVEEQAIEGAKGTLEKSRPLLIAERHSPKQLKDFEALIAPFKYKRVKEWKGVHTFAWRAV